MIKTGNINFWIAQTVGWTLMAGMNLVVQNLAGFPRDLLLYNSLTPMLVGFLLTTVYRYIIRRLDWRKWNLPRILLLLMVSTLILATIFLLSVYAIIRLLYGGHEITLPAFLSSMFIFSLIILTWNLIYFSIHYFNNWTEAETDKWKLTAEMRDAQLASLKTQIRPHFVFNTINNIRSLILEDSEKAREMLLHFSDLFRYALKNTEQSTVELKDELEIVNQYLELLSIQFEDKLQFTIQVDKSLESLKLPPMMLQILLENAVKHGISKRKDGGAILISIQEENGFANIMVQNSGKMNTSTDLDEQMGVGLENIRRRLELIYNGKANLGIRELENNVLAIIKIPLS
jgi:sensor histidine kinase YesM